MSDDDALMDAPYRLRKEIENATTLQPVDPYNQLEAPHRRYACQCVRLKTMARSTENAAAVYAHTLSLAYSSVEFIEVR